MTRTSKHLIVLALTAALALCVAISAAAGLASAAPQKTAAATEHGGKSAKKRCVRKHREAHRSGKCRKAKHARHGRGKDDPAGDDRGAARHGGDDPAGDDHGSGGHGADSRR